MLCFIDFILAKKQAEQKAKAVSKRLREEANEDMQKIIDDLEKDESQLFQDTTTTNVSKGMLHEFTNTYSVLYDLFLHCLVANCSKGMLCDLMRMLFCIYSFYVVCVPSFFY